MRRAFLLTPLLLALLAPVAHAGEAREKQLAKQVRALRADLSTVKRARNTWEARAILAREQRDRLIGERSQAITERNEATTQRDQAVRDRDAAAAQRDAALAGLPASIGAVGSISDIYRLVFAPLRDRPDLCASYYSSTPYFSVTFTKQDQYGC